MNTKIESIEHGVRIETQYETRLFFAVGQEVHEWTDGFGGAGADEFPSAPYNWPGNGARPATKQVCRGLRHTGTPITAGASLLATIREEWAHRSRNDDDA